MYIIVLLTLIYIVTPVFIIYLTENYRIANRIGAVIIAYTSGLILGHAGIMPAGSDYFLDIFNSNPKLTLNELMYLKSQNLIEHSDIILFKTKKLQDLLTTITISLAIPLLLFASNIKSWLHMAGRTLISMTIAIISVVSLVSLGYFIFNNKINELWKISGMLIGVYSGGTPNLASLKIMLEVDAETYILTHTYDTIVSVVYLFFLISIGKNIFRNLLGSYPAKEKYYNIRNNILGGEYTGILKKEKFIPLFKALGLSVIVFAAAGALSLLVPEKSVMIVFILTLTTLGILLSLLHTVNKIEKTFESGMYFILVFSIIIASMVDITKLVSLSSSLFYYISIVIFGSLFLHIIISRIFKIDADTVMITSTALICSPPFVPVVAGALKNKEIIVSGLTVGIIGYAIGNYIGVLLAYFLKGL